MRANVSRLLKEARPLLVRPMVPRGAKLLIWEVGLAGTTLKEQEGQMTWREMKTVQLGLCSLDKYSEGFGDGPIVVFELVG